MEQLMRMVSNGGSRELVEAISTLSLKRYLAQSDDIRLCPTPGCKYGGFIVEDELANCSKPLNCNACGNHWVDKIQNQKWLPSFERFRNNLQKLMFTKLCPNCGIGI